ncbi:MAG: tRNA epoxyqueuosine(34) reductase QueG, partial [Armatimonadetes bacterium]|nr:tRNA epoxyqueuosine(34) reductase QueG [Armatimonadota bacterium]
PASLRFARYALNDDYHDWMRPRLRALGAAIESVLHEQRSAGVSPATSACRWRPFCDTSAVLEREHAFGAGLGWIGKNTMLINRSLGSHILIGGIVVDRELEPDPPAPGTCGRCRRCLDACPTGAIVAPYILDARLCIAYHTIESRGPIPEAVAKHMGDRVFGCDICQEVCPFNGPRVPETGHPEFMPRAAAIGRSANDLASITDDEFRMQFRRSAVRRAKPAGLRRNAIASMKSTGEGPAGPSPPDPSDPSDPPAYLSRSAFARFA